MDKFHISRLSSFSSLANLVIVVLCVLLSTLVSCSSDDDITKKPVSPSITTNETPIGFSNDEGTTRGAIEDKSALATSGFGVFAMMPNRWKTYGISDTSSVKYFLGAFMTNVQVKSSDNGATWTYNPLRYWPNDKGYSISFLAYAPYSDGTSLVDKDGTTTGTSDPTYITYTLTSNKSDLTKDLLYNSYNTLNQQYYDDENGKKTTDYVNGNGTLQLNFKHATARIGFVVTSTELKKKYNFTDGQKTGNPTITVNQVEFCKMSKSSDYPAAIKRRVGVGTRAISDATGAFYASGLLNINPSASDDSRWSNQTGAVYFSFNDTGNPQTYEGNLTKSSTDNSKWVWTAESKTQTSNINATIGTTNDTTVIAIGNSSSDYMFIIPQDFTGGGTSSETSSVEGVPAGDGPNVEDDNALICYVKYTVKETSSDDGTSYESYGVIRKNFKAGNAYLIFINIGNSDGASTPSTNFKSVRFTISEKDNMSTETTIGE